MSGARINDDPFNLRDLAIAVWRFDDHPARRVIRRLEEQFLRECGSAGGSLAAFLEWIDWLAVHEEVGLLPPDPPPAAE